MKEAKVRYLVYAVIGVCIIVFLWLYISSYSIKSRAANETATLGFQVTDLPGDSGISVKIKIIPSGAITLQMYKILLNFDKAKLQAKSIAYKAGTVASGGGILSGYTNSSISAANTNGYVRLVGVTLGTTGGLTIGKTQQYEVAEVIFNATTVPSSVTVATNTSTLTVINSAYELYNVPIAAATAPINGDIPASNLPSGSGVTMNLKLKFQGIMKLPAENLRTMQVRIKLSGGSLSEAVTQTGSFIASEVEENGNKKIVWNGNVNFPTGSAGSGYILYIKGSKQIQKKICDASPSDGATVGSYRCEIGHTLQLTTSNTLDFSNIWLLSGDLPEQDGIVDSYDGSLIRNNLGKTDELRCDINLDGICDSQDWSLLIQALSVKYDEE